MNQNIATAHPPITVDAQVVTEDYHGLDPQRDPAWTGRVGFRIGSRIFWTGNGSSFASLGDYHEGRGLADEIVSRWNAMRDPFIAKVVASLGELYSADTKCLPERSSAVAVEALIERVKLARHDHTTAHDDAHDASELADAAAAYAAVAGGHVTLWPWPNGFDPKKTPRDALICAIALAIAAVERIDCKAAANARDAVVETANV